MAICGTPMLSLREMASLCKTRENSNGSCATRPFIARHPRHGRCVQGEKKAMEEPSEVGLPVSLDQWTLRPLGAWLWPVAVGHT